MTLRSDREMRELVKVVRRTVATEVAKVANAPSIGNSSFEGAVTEYDLDGNPASVIGRQVDGTHAPVVLVGPTPPTPTAPTVTPRNIGAAGFSWDGTYVDGAQAPLDFARAVVHIGTAADFEPDSLPSSVTKFGAIESDGGGTAVVKHDAGDYFARLVVVSKAGKVSEASEAVPVHFDSVLNHDDVVAVVQAAGGGVSMIFTTNAAPDPDPEAANRVEGDTWWQIEKSPETGIVAMWRWGTTEGATAPAWQPQQLTSEMLANLSAGKIAAGAIQAAVTIASSGTIIAGDPEGANAAMTSDGFRVFAVTDDGTQYESTRLGTGSDEAFEIIKEAGQPPVASISSDGDLSAQGGAFAGDITLGGQPLAGTMLDDTAGAGLLDQLSRGAWAMVSYRDLLDGKTYSSTPDPIIVGQTQARLHPGRKYMLTMPWDATFTDSTRAYTQGYARIYASVAANETADAADATASSTLASEASVRHPLAASFGVSGLNLASFSLPSGTVGSRQVKFMLAVRSLFGGMKPTTGNTSAWILSIDDLGPLPAISKAAVSGAAGEQTYQSTWRASDSRAWLSTGVQIQGDGTATMRHGAYGASDTQAHSAFVCNGNAISGETTKTMTAALNGATISKVEVYLYVSYWRTTSGMELQIRPWSGSTLPTTHTAGTTGSVVKKTYAGKGQGLWTEIPTSWISTTNRGIQVGPPDWLGDTTAAQLAGSTWSTATQRPMIRVTYSRQTGA